MVVFFLFRNHVTQTWSRQGHSLSLPDFGTSLDTLSSHSVSRDSHEPMALNIQPDFRSFFRGVVTPPLMPQGQMPSTCWIHLQWVLSLSLSLSSWVKMDAFRGTKEKSDMDADETQTAEQLQKKRTLVEQNRTSDEGRCGFSVKPGN